MPIKGFTCSLHREDVPFDHYETCTANKGRPAFPPWAAKQIADGVLSDVRHSGIELTATGTMGCPRQRFINMTQHFHIDPTWRYVAARGTALHSAAAKYMNPEVYITEETDPMRMDVRGRLWAGAFEEDGDIVTEEGVRISALLDAIRHDMTEIIDWKFPKDWNVSYRKDNKPEHRVQMNIGRLLLAQQPWAIENGYDPDNVLLTIWDHSAGRTEIAAPLVIAHMDDMAMLDMKTGPDSEYLIGDVITQTIEDYKNWKQMQEDSDTPEDIERYAAGVPCMGEAKFRGQGCAKYCDCRKESARLMRKYGRPEEINATGPDAAFNLAALDE